MSPLLTNNPLHCFSLFSREDVQAPRALWLDVILYTRAQIILENEGNNTSSSLLFKTQ
jgi:hypothetical protein